MRAAIVALVVAVSASAAVRQTYYRPQGPKPQAVGDPTVVNAASFLPGVSPGGLVTIFGQDLTSVSGTVSVSSNPLPTVLAGVEVDVNGIPAAIFSITFANGEDQITIQVPYETDVGPGAAVVEVFDHGEQTASLVADSFTEDPGIFTYNGTFAVAEAAADGSLIGPDNPAIPGEVIVLYTTGLGPVSVVVPDGYEAPFSPLADTTSPLNVFVAGEGATVLFSGLSPGFVGLYQVNFVVPRDAPPGNLSLQIQTPFSSSQTATLPVE